MGPAQGGVEEDGYRYMCPPLQRAQHTVPRMANGRLGDDPARL